MIYYSNDHVSFLQEFCILLVYFISFFIGLYNFR